MQGSAKTIPQSGRGGCEVMKELRRRAPLAAIAILLSVTAALGQDQWWQFRGPHGNGHVQAPNLPLNWTEDKNIAWKTPIHDRGWSSPVIWNNQIWLTTATADGSKMFAVCVDKSTGRILHDIHSGLGAASDTNSLAGIPTGFGGRGKQEKSD